MAILEIKDVSKEFKRQGKKFYALNNINLEIKKGEIFALLGPNGAGKTTLLNIIMSLLYPDTGSVKILDKDIRKNREILSNLGYVSGDERFHWSLTPADVLNFGGMMHGLSKDERTKRAAELVKLFGLDDVLHSKFSVLSTGERMRLAFSYALINSPKILLLDEPTLGLDPDIAIRIRKEIRRTNRELGTTIILTSHYMAEVEQLADRIAFINHGEIKDIGTVASIREHHPNLESYFLEMINAK